MKKVFAILMVICMLASVLCITAFAAEPDEGTVLSASALKTGGFNVKGVREIVHLLLKYF